MSLTAKEWLLLPEEEQEKRKNELSSHESFLLRTLYEQIHFSEEEKKTMSEERKRAFLNPSEPAPELEQRRKEGWDRIMKEWGLLPKEE